MPTLYRPFLNPVKFTKLVPDAIPQYVSKHMDDYLFAETIFGWEQEVHGFQLWQINDTIKLQFQSTYGPITLSLYSCTGIRLHTVSVDQVRQNYDFPTRYIYEVSLSMQAFLAGTYYLQLECGNPVIETFVSEPFKLSELIENTLLLEYKHRVYKDDVFFETGFAPSIRIPGVLPLKEVGSIDTVYEDQESNLEMIKSVGYEIYQLNVGLTYGIPPWMIKRLNRMLGCSTTKLDGRLYTKPEGAKFERNVIEDYPLSGWAIDVREKLQRNSTISENESQVNGEFAVAIVSDTKGFGSQDAGSNYLITDVQ
jgi:hypothetical protein